MSARQHILAILFLPFTVTILFPLILIFLSCLTRLPWLFIYSITILSLVIGCVFITLGLSLLYKTNRAFACVGKGTLAPWTPTRQFVGVGLYQYVRNPMILGVLLVLLGEAILFGSTLLFCWCMIFWVMNHIWFIHWEEPDLEQRFGDEYREYKAHAPRWIPRSSPWNAETQNEKSQNREMVVQSASHR